MKQWKRWMCLIEAYVLMIIFFVGGLAFNGAEAAAKGSNAKAKTAYNALLKKARYKDRRFCLVDIDQNGTDELVIESNGWGFSEIHTYSAGSVQKVKYPKKYKYDSGDMAWEDAIGYRPAYNPKRKEFFADYVGAGGAVYGVIFKMEKGSLVKKHDLYWYHETTIMDDKYISYEEMNKIYDRYTGDFALQWITNTATNRNLYLKNEKKLSVITGNSKKIGLSAQFAKSISYKSSNKAIATVNKKGKITAKKPGTAKVTATVNYYGHTEKYVIYVTVKKSKNSYGIKGLDYKGDMAISIDKAYEKNKKYYIHGSLSAINYDDFSDAKSNRVLKKSITFRLEDTTKIYAWIRVGDADFKTKLFTPKELMKGKKKNWVFPDVRSMFWAIEVKDGKVVLLDQIWP